MTERKNLIRMKGNFGITGFAGVASVVVMAIALGCSHADPYHKAGPSAVHAEPLHLTGGWGYTIEVNHKLYIYQDQIPCIPGKRLFSSRRQAMAAAQIVVNKIKKGEPPSLQKAELEKILPVNN